MEDDTLKTPRGLRLHIGIFGRRNVGKSALLNALTGQGVSIVSEQPGTTTDVVEKTLEYPPLGPVVFLDTAGLDDEGSLGAQRNEASRRAMRRVDAALLVAEGENFAAPERAIAGELRALGVPFAILRNKTDLLAGHRPSRPDGLDTDVPVLDVSARSGLGLELVPQLLRGLLPMAGEENPPLLRDLAPSGGSVILVAPIDTGAPRGRLILPQVQAIRDCLDGGIASTVCRESEYAGVLAAHGRLPDLVVCDSQVIGMVAPLTPAGVPLTTFSILMARMKGDLAELARGAAVLHGLVPGDAVLIQEACSHHAQKDDIATVKLPRLLRRMAGGDLDIRYASGKGFSACDPGVRLVLHCGGCVITRRQMLGRLEDARAAGVPMTNYGLAISAASGVLERVLGPFPAALAAYREATGNHLKRCGKDA